MKKISLALLLALFVLGCSNDPGHIQIPAPPCPTCVAVKFTNNYGKDMVISMVQGALPGQTVAQVPWLKYNAASYTYSWEVPNNPQSNADLAPYMFEIGAGKTLIINVPQYTANVGFRGLIADTMFKHNALQQLVTSTDTIPYMCFPNLLTANYVFDKFEAGLTQGTPGIWNMTAVDFVAIPMQLSMQGDTVGFCDGVTANGLMSLLSGLGAPYSAGGTMSPNTSTNTYRFFAPANVSSATTVLDSAIAQGLPALVNFQDTVCYGNFQFWGFTQSIDTASPITGTVTCNFLNSAAKVYTPTSITVNNVTTVAALQGVIVGTSTDSILSSAETELGALLSAALCRGVLASPSQWGIISAGSPNCAIPNYYYPTNGTFDAYANIIHQYSIGGKNYAFPYDDYFSEEAGFTVAAGDSVTINLLPQSGTMTATPNPRPALATGFLSVNIPTGINYPASSANWSIGPIIINSNLVPAGNTTMCSLSADTITCTFPSYPDVTMYLYPNATNGTNYSFKGKANGKTVTGIVGMNYIVNQQNLSFGAATAWNY